MRSHCGFGLFFSPDHVMTGPDLFDAHVEADVGGGDDPVGQVDIYSHSSSLLFVKKAHLEKLDCNAACTQALWFAKFGPI